MRARVAQELAPGSVTANALHFFDVATAQECLEMIGAVLFAYALADRLPPWQGTLRLARGG